MFLPNSRGPAAAAPYRDPVSDVPVLCGPLPSRRGLISLAAEEGCLSSAVPRPKAWKNPARRQHPAEHVRRLVRQLRPSKMEELRGLDSGVTVPDGHGVRVGEGNRQVNLKKQERPNRSMIPAVPLVPGMLTRRRRPVAQYGTTAPWATAPGRYTRRGQRAVAQLGERACFGCTRSRVRVPPARRRDSFSCDSFSSLLGVWDHPRPARSSK